MVCPFLWFITAGANIFTVPKLRDNGAMLGQISFISGMVCVLVMGLFYRLLVPAALCGAVLTLAALILYECTRHTVVDRNFYVGLSGGVPPVLCEEGPYRYVRHPFYLSYMAAFIGVAVVFQAITNRLGILNKRFSIRRNPLVDYLNIRAILVRARRSAGERLPRSAASIAPGSHRRLVAGRTVPYSEASASAVV